MDRFLVFGAVQVEPVRDVRKLDQDLSPNSRFLADFPQAACSWVSRASTCPSEATDARHHLVPNQEGVESRPFRRRRPARRPHT